MLSLIAEVYTVKNLKSVGFGVSQRTHDNAISHARVFGPGMEVPKPKQPPSKKQKDSHVRAAVLKFLTDNSKPCPSRFVVMKTQGGRKLKKTVRELEGWTCAEVLTLNLENGSTLYRLFVEKNPTIVLSASTFRSLTPKYFKKPLRKTDLCHICAEQTQLQKELTRASPQEQVEIQAKIQEISAHKKMKDVQRKQCMMDKLNLKSKCAILQIDFKENVNLGRGPEELGRDFYNRPLRAILGFVMWFVENGKLQKQEIDFVSECLNKDSLFVADCLDLIRAADYWKRHQFEKVTIWTDNCGSHFKTREFLGYLTKWRKDLKEVSLKFT